MVAIEINAFVAVVLEFNGPHTFQVRMQIIYCYADKRM